jgi:Mrp family chromosome partitioning ATPase/capsular polysaccharide biosynthesis protein
VSGVTDPTADTPLRAYARAIRAHRGLVALVVLATLAGSLIWLAVRTPEYEASARFLINPVSQDDEAVLGLPLLRDAGDPTRTAQTAAALMQSPEAAATTARRLGDPWSAEKVLDAVDVEPAGQSNILALTATADTPGGAAALANTFAEASIEARDARLRTAVEAALARLGQAQPTPEATEPGAAPSGTSDRQARLQDLRLAGDPSITLAEPATRPTEASGAPWWLVLALALMGGGVLGAGAALIAELRSPRPLAGEDELVSLVPGPLLARLPDDWHRFRSEPRSGSATPSEIAFRSVHVQLGLVGGERRSIMVSSPGDGDGKTNFVASMALRLAAEGQDVIVMDLNLHAPRTADLLGVNPEPGLAAALEPGGSLASALIPVAGIPGLRIVPGVHDDRLSALDALHFRLPRLLADAHSLGSHVLLDTPPLGTLSDAALLLEGIDELVVVVRVGHTRVVDVEAMRDVLWRVRRRPAGYVVIGGGPRAVHQAPPPARPEPAAFESQLPGSSYPGPYDRELGDLEFEPGDRVAWRRDGARGTGEVVRRLSAPKRGNAWEIHSGEAEPRYLIKTERAGERLACRASSLTRVSSGQ